MSIQDTINEAKKEFSNDEQMLASAFKLEKFYKKNKIAIFALVAVVILFFGGRAVMGVMEESRLNAANDAYLTLSKDAHNKVAEATLKAKNPELFELYSYKNAIENSDLEALKVLSSSKNEIIADISAYHLAVLEKRPAQSELYGEVALVNNAHLLIKEGKVAEAKDQLSQISEESPVHNIAKIIKHYTIKGQ